MPDLFQDPHGLAALARGACRIAVLTGAGVSTESGVPDFRSPGSPWLIHKPITYAQFLSGPAMRAEAWRRKFAMDDLYRGARPNRAHEAMVRLDEAGRLVAVITQNIDGLHGAAGLRPERLIELHGNGTYARCLSCGLRYELAEVRRHLDETGAAPECSCGGFIKSATISFGQPLARGDLERSLSIARACDLFVAAGSSLVVRPAATLPRLARSAGAVLVILNREPTPLDGEADHVFRCDAGAGLMALADAVAEDT